MLAFNVRHRQPVEPRTAKEHIIISIENKLFLKQLEYFYQVKKQTWF